ncbi:MAG: septal ring lytic transglycosylase RlpA family protein [Ferruginibacter sp.]
MKENILFKTAALYLILLIVSLPGYAQKDTSNRYEVKASNKNQRFFYGLASFYSDKFHGRKTANGEIFKQNKFTAACNVLPLGTWIRVTNLRNGKSIILKTTDRLHPRMRRLVDLSSSAAKKLDYVSRGLTRVKVEVLNQKTHK